MRIGRINISRARSAPASIPPIDGSTIVASAPSAYSPTTRLISIAEARGMSQPDAMVSPAKLDYGRDSTSSSRAEWNDPEFNLKDIAGCLVTEAFFRRIMDKYVELIWRNGYSLSGKNLKTVGYIRERLRQISMVTDVPTWHLWRSISHQLVVYSNCFVEKVRNIRASGGRLRTTFYGKSLNPVAGYYVVDATSMRIAKTRHGEVVRYKQEIRGKEGKMPEWRPDDMIHIVKDREPGLIFGTPMAVPVLDDMRALRRIEENVEMLIFSHAIPLYQYLVGDEDNKPHDGNIQAAKAVVRDMPTEGMLVTPYYHQVKAVGAEGRALRVEGYLDYFRNRVFAGLGASEVAMGYSGSASRSAADTIEKGMFNTVREFQNIISLAIEEFVFKELMAEGGYEWDDRTRVEFSFPEIDIDDKVKFENHIVNLYNANLMTASEARIAIGKEPMTPDERMDTFFYHYELPNNLIRAVDEPFMASIPSVVQRLARHMEGRARAVASLDMPSNQYGTKMAPGTTKDSEVIDVDNEVIEADGVVISDDINVQASRLLVELGHEEYSSTLQIRYSSARSDSVQVVRSRYVDGYEVDGVTLIDVLTDYDKSNIEMVVRLAGNEMSRDSYAYISRAFSIGVEDACDQAGVSDVTFDHSSAMEYMAGKNTRWIGGVMDTIVDVSEKVMRDVSSTGDAVPAMMNVFDSNWFRIHLGARNELQRAYNIGVLMGGTALGYDRFHIDVGLDEDGKCGVHEGKSYNISPDINLDAIPPGMMTHPLCTCRVKLGPAPIKEV